MAVGVAIKAGARNEGYDNAVVTHALCYASGMATSKTTRDVSDISVEFLVDSVSSSLLWEVQRTLPRLKLELSTRTPATQALKLLHSAAFRSSLGNRLYCLMLRFVTYILILVFPLFSIALFSLSCNR